MKIAVVTACTSTLPNYRLDMIKEFLNRDNEVIVFGDDCNERWNDFFEQWRIGYRQYSVSRNGLNPIHDLKTKKELKRLFRQENIECVWTYQVKPNIYGCLAAHEAGIDKIYAMMGGLGSVFRGSDVKSRILKKIVAAEYKSAFKHVTKVFFQNTEDLGLFEELSIVDRDATVLTRGSGVNLIEFERKPLPDNPSFIFVGRLVRGKGVFEYLDAARIVKAKYPDSQFHLVGSMDSNPTSLTEEQLIPYIQDGTVLYHGQQDDVRPFLEKASCFVLPSYYGEGTPKSGLEAMAMGRPLVMADAVGCREVVKDGVNGFLVSPKSVSELADALSFFAEDTNHAKVMGEESYRMAVDVFDVDKVNDVICRAMGL